MLATRFGDPVRSKFYFDRCFDEPNKKFGDSTFKDLCKSVFNCEDGSCAHNESKEPELEKEFYEDFKEAYDHELEDVFKRKASIIFNAFIFMQACPAKTLAIEPNNVVGESCQFISEF